MDVSTDGDGDDKTLDDLSFGPMGEYRLSVEGYWMEQERNVQMEERYHDHNMGDSCMRFHIETGHIGRGYVN